MKVKNTEEVKINQKRNKDGKDLGRLRRITKRNVKLKIDK